MYAEIITCADVKRIFPHLRESLEDVGQHLQHRLPACVMLIAQLRHHEIQVTFQLLPHWVIQEVFQIDLQRVNNS